MTDDQNSAESREAGARPTWTVCRPGRMMRSATQSPDVADPAAVISRTIDASIDRLLEADLSLRLWASAFNTLGHVHGRERELSRTQREEVDRLRQGGQHEEARAADARHAAAQAESDAQAETCHRGLHLHARGHLLALHDIGDFVRALGELPLEAAQKGMLSRLANDFDHQFPNLTDVRNSVSHLGDRFRLIGQGGAAINPPVRDAMIGMQHGPGYVVIAGRMVQARFVTDVQVHAGRELSWGGFFDDRYHILLGDGTIGEIPLRPDNLIRAAALVQRLVDCFSQPPYEWAGGEQVVSRSY